ncbi:TRAP transporter TatT component family protein [Arenimonas fontis]|uniref:TRAP transporter TatT component family protein n=1 Tax=Arenimonas fontis TaxID=2608255 RepID=A0A5B2Z8V4_9GAMM|nr:TRAP transporter TatT component family protein [Arenimonas fontis]KAA2284419.1 hypothetical protein F0415_08800 [Arenimonas fontis]
MPITTRRFFRLALIAALAALLAACAAIAGRAGDRLAAQLGQAVVDSDDPATVRDGLPAYLLLIDGLIADGKPDSPRKASLLLAAAELNGAYAGNFTGDDAVRARRMAAKALDYARRSICVTDEAICRALDGDIPAFEAAVAKASAEDVKALYGLAAAWAGVLQANSGDWGLIAELPKVQALLERVVEIEPGHGGGMAQAYLGVLHSLRPESFGGQPGRGRQHFEQAIALSGGRNLMARTLMAEYYARLVFDQDLHDRLLGEVLAADPVAPGYTLMNVLAQERARKLLESGKDYF